MVKAQVEEVVVEGTALLLPARQQGTARRMLVRRLRPRMTDLTSSQMGCPLHKLSIQATPREGQQEKGVVRWRRCLSPAR